MPAPAPILVFDIETIPDVATGKRLYPEIANLDDEQALTALIALREQEVNSPFMRQPLHKIACLSFLWVENGNLTLKSLSLGNHSEAQILATFFRAFEKQPTLVSWNGRGFDIPVIMYRALQYNLSVPKFFSEMGDMKYNNYLNRYHDRHTDLMLKMAMGAAYQPLDTVASLCGFAGKQDIDGTMVVDLVKNNDWQTLTTYCESDVINTWLLYLRWQRLTGKMPSDMATSWEDVTRQYLHRLKNTDNSLRHDKFLTAWALDNTVKSDETPATAVNDIQANIIADIAQTSEINDTGDTSDTTTDDNA